MVVRARSYASCVDERFRVKVSKRCAVCGEREDPFAADCCECLQCERCGVRSPLRVENAAVVVPAGWRLDDVHLCWRCVEHTDVAAFLEQHS
jgi:hypothetical protein